MSLWSDFTGAVKTEADAPAEAVTVAEGFYRVITDGALWRSLGWLLLGLVLAGLGLIVLLRRPVEGAVGNVAKSVAF